jgi:hypothetical protein
MLETIQRYSLLSVVLISAACGGGAEPMTPADGTIHRPNEDSNSPETNPATSPDTIRTDTGAGTLRGDSDGPEDESSATPGP